MFPVILGNGRCLQADVTIEGYHVPKGVFIIFLLSKYIALHACILTKLIKTFQTHVIFPHYVVSNDEEYFRDPKRFSPERWMKSGCPHQDKIHPFVSLPFGYGRRTCLGRRFAEAELQIILAKASCKCIYYSVNELNYSQHHRGFNGFIFNYHCSYLENTKWNTTTALSRTE